MYKGEIWNFGRLKHFIFNEGFAKTIVKTKPHDAKNLEPDYI